MPHFLSFLLLLGLALSAPILIDFEGTPDRVQIDDYYSPQGVYFGPNLYSYFNETTRNTLLLTSEVERTYINVPEGFNSLSFIFFSSEFSSVTFYPERNGEGISSNF